jgi:uncharacterized protein (DUF2252 family)
MKHPIRLLEPGRAARVVNALTEWNEYLSADDLHEKYCKMAVSPFVFYRGTAHLFWADFADDWRQHRFGCRRTRTWLQGDAHAENMGAFNDQKGRLVYGLNDFDEGVIGDYQYDLWRFAVSLVLVARRNGGFSGASKAKIVNALSSAYLDTMASYVGNKKALGRTFSAGSTTGLLQSFLEETEADKSRKKMLKKWTDKQDGGRRFDMSIAKLAPASRFEQGDIRAAMTDYGKTLSGSVTYDGKVFAVRDIARRLSAGTGSLGTPRYYVLIQGDGDSDKGNRILDVKRQGKPSAYDHLSKEQQVDYDRTYLNDAQRQAVAYEALGRQPDAFMGWMKLHNGYYSVRERSPLKETFPTDSLTTATAFVEMTKAWAEVMATYHARAVRDLRVDGKKYSIADEVTERTKSAAGRRDFLAMVRDYAFEYANQVEADYATFMEAIQPDDCGDFI